MQIWIQLKDHHEDVHFSGEITYAMHPSGALRVNSGGDIHLYSPAYWQEITVDTRIGDTDESSVELTADEWRWQ